MKVADQVQLINDCFVEYMEAIEYVKLQHALVGPDQNLNFAQNMGQISVRLLDAQQGLKARQAFV